MALTHAQLIGIDAKNLSRKALLLLGWAILACDDHATISIADLVRLVGATSYRAIGDTLRELENAGVMVRMPIAIDAVGRKLPRIVRLSLPSVLSAKTCVNCKVRPVKNVAGARWCALCQATLSRHDRSWKAIAVEIWADGKRNRHSESKIAYRVHAATGKPLFSTSFDGEATEGVIPFMMRMRLLNDPYWVDAVRAAEAREE